MTVVNLGSVLSASTKMLGIMAMSILVFQCFGQLGGFITPVMSVDVHEWHELKFFTVFEEGWIFLLEYGEVESTSAEAKI